MNRKTPRLAVSLVAIGAALAVPVWAVSLPDDNGVAPPEGKAAPSTQYAAASLTAGSASLVPLMIAEMEANHVAALDINTDASGGAVNKPIDDITFVRQATVSSRKEIKSAREALPQLKQPELKRIAEMLVSDHSGANERLAKIAEAKSWPVPGPQAPSAPPSGTAISDFDARWTAEMIAAHERSVAMYREQARSGEDNDLRKYASDTLPTIERHLAELKGLQK
jgi:putative membrane protein